MLLLYLPLLLALRIGEGALGELPQPIHDFFGASASNGFWLLLAAALLALAFLVSSAISRRPQLQFAAEFFLAALGFVAWPVY